MYYGARLEYQALRGNNAAVKNANGDYVGRFANYYLGATAIPAYDVEGNQTGYMRRSFQYKWLSSSRTHPNEL